MKWFLAVIVGLVLLIAVAVAYAPASVVPTLLTELEKRQLIPADAPRLKLLNTSGTVWNGQAAEAIVDIDGVPMALGQLSWQLSASSLLGGTPVVDVVILGEQHNLKGKVTVNQQGVVRADNIEGRLPISMLEPWLPMLVKGEMALVIDHWIFSQDELIALDGVINLEYVDWLGGAYDMPLGNYMGQVSVKDKLVHIQLNDFSARLGIDGLLSITPTGNYLFNATLQPREGLAPEVAETIGWFGKRDANGDVLISKRGRF